jgi:hypothetical protein
VQVSRVLDGLAALCEAAPCSKCRETTGPIRRAMSYASRDAAQPYVRALVWGPQARRIWVFVGRGGAN